MSVKRYTIYYNERERDMYVAESQDGKYCLHSDYAALLARHNALREAVAWEMECCQDIRPLFAWSGLYLRHGEGYVDGVAEDLRAIQEAARAEVDRLIANEGSADCEGE